MVMNRTSLWSALSSTALISLAPNLILYLFPKFGTEEGANSSSIHEHAVLLSLGQALAAGGLLGDVFLHALPDAKEGDDLEQVGLRILTGFGIFLTLDVLIRSMGGDDDDGDVVAQPQQHGHHHNHNHDQVLQQQREQPPAQDTAAAAGLNDVANHHGGTTTTTEQQQVSASTAATTTKSASVWHLFLQSSVLLNLTADSLHNLTDGMAIGAAFAATSLRHHQEDDHHHQHAAAANSMLSMSWLTSRGGLATLSILFHEIPHELGDFCVLVRAGFTRNQAVLLQFVTAIAAMIGSVLGVYCVEVFGDALVHLTAGGFVYLSTVTLLPSVLETQRHVSLPWRLAQLLAFGAGVALMYSVVLLEGDDHHHHHHDSHDHHQHLPISAGKSHSEL